MSEHLAIVNVTSAQTVKFAIPKDGIIYGVYSSSNITIGYDDNGNVGTLKTNVSEWEPNPGFRPSPISYLVLTASAPVQISIRYEV